jgi:hypothetical protein
MALTATDRFNDAMTREIGGVSAAQVTAVTPAVGAAAAQIAAAAPAADLAAIDPHYSPFGEMAHHHFHHMRA